MLDLEKTLDVSMSAAITAGNRVLELSRNNLIVPDQVNRRVINYKDGAPEGKPFYRTLKKTNADILSHDTIVEILRREFPEFPVLSEEEYIKVREVPTGTPYFIVDPIDGTIHLEKGSSQWTINVALCVDGNPIMGVVVVPAENKVYFGTKEMASQWSLCESPKKRNSLKPPKRSRPDLIVSQCAPEDLGGAEDSVPSTIMEANSLSYSYMSGSAYRYTEIATGAIDLIVHGMGNFLWDKAAAQVIIEGTGGKLVELPWNSSKQPTGEIIAETSSCLPMQYHANKLKDDGHIVLSQNAVEGLEKLVIPDSVDRRSFWKFVII